MKRGMVASLAVASMLTGNARAEKPGRPSGHEQVSGWPTNVFQSLEYGVELAVDGYVSETGGKTGSGIVLARAAFDLEGVVNDWLMGHVGLLWEDGTREEENLDEAYIALGASETIPFYLVAGRFYQPVGNFESVFISYPLTFSLAQLNQTSAMIGYNNRWIDLNGGVFSGDVKEGTTTGDSSLGDFYASATFTPVASVKSGVYWLSDLMETYYQSKVGRDIADLPGYEKAGLAGAFANLYLGRFTFAVEYVSAIGGYDLPGGRYVPAAFNLEGSVQVHEKVTAGLKYEASDDLYATVDRTGPLRFGDKFPGQSYGAVVSYAFLEHAAFSAEYLHAEELDNGASGNMVTLELGLVLK